MTLEEALKEVREKTIAEINKETAFVWAYRALASYKIFTDEGDTSRLFDASAYRGEALEHAALAEDDGETFRAVSALLEGIR